MVTSLLEPPYFCFLPWHTSRLGKTKEKHTLVYYSLMPESGGYLLSQTK